MIDVEIENMSYSYDRKTKVLHDVSLNIDGPGLYCIIGPNGVGKSTLVKCINKILEPTEGEVTIDGKSTKEMRYKEISKIIGYVPAVSQDCFSMSVVDTIMVGRFNHRKWGSTKKDLEIVYKAMKLLHLEKLAMRRDNELSAGQRQRVSIARGIVQEPKILILDEPTANLDVKYQVYVTELLRAFSEKEKIAVIMISHDLNIAAKFAHKIIMMVEPGTIHKVGSPEEVITEEDIRRVYGIECKIIKEGKCPHVILGSPLMENMEEDMDDAVPQEVYAVGS